MAEATGTITKVRVTWRQTGSAVRHVTTVQLIEGYSTENDIPRILATNLMGSMRFGFSAEELAARIVICNVKAG